MYTYITMNVMNQIFAKFFLDVIIYKILMVEQTFIGLALQRQRILLC
jgi:hypothetical protein